MKKLTLLTLFAAMLGTAPWFYAKAAGGANAVVAAAPADAVAPNDDVAPPPEVNVPGKELYTLFSINNVGFIDVCGCPKKKLRQGSVTRRSSFVKQLKARGRKVMMIDGGNTLFGPDDPRAEEFEKPQLVEKAKVIIEAYNRMDYKVMNVGHLDLTMGLEQLKKFEEMANFPFICGNLAYKESGKLVFPATHEVEVHGVKVGFFGLILQEMQPSFYEKRAPGVVLLDGIEQAKKFVPGLAERNDIVFVLSYNKPEHHQKLISEVEGIDFIIDPYLDPFGTFIRGRIEEPDFMTLIDDVVLGRTKAEGHSLGTLDLRYLDESDKWVNRASITEPAELEKIADSSYHFWREKVEPHFLNDPEIDLLVEAFKKGAFENTPRLGNLPHKDRYLTEKTCQACHAEQYAWWKKTDHADAFESIERTGDQWRQDCIGCHTLGYGAAFVHPEDSEPYHNVQCESCHGTNPKHPSNPAAHKWPKIREMTCLKCHNKSQTREDFKYPSKKRKVACPKMKR